MNTKTVIKIKYLIKIKEFETAKKIIYDNLSIDKNNIDLMLLLIECLNFKENTDEILRILEQIIELDTDNYTANLKLYKHYMKTSKYDKALFYILKIEHYNTLEINYSLSKIYYELKLYDKALLYSKRALTLDENDIYVLVLLIQINTILKDFDAAFIYAKKAKLLDSKNTYTLIATSKLYKEIGNYKDAIFELKKVIKINKNLIIVHLELIKLYIITKKYEQLKQAIINLIKVDKDNTCYSKIKFEIKKISNNKKLQHELLDLLNSQYTSKINSYNLTKSNRKKKLLKEETRNNFDLIQDICRHHPTTQNNVSLAHILNHCKEDNYKENHTIFNGDIFYFLEYFFSNIDKATKEQIPNNRLKFTLFCKECGFDNTSNIKKNYLDYLILIFDINKNEIISFFPSK